VASSEAKKRTAFEIWGNRKVREFDQKERKEQYLRSVVLDGKATGLTSSATPYLPVGFNCPIFPAVPLCLAMSKVGRVTVEEQEEKRSRESVRLQGSPDTFSDFLRMGLTSCFNQTWSYSINSNVGPA